jgi:hypothetical protein
VSTRRTFSLLVRLTLAGHIGIRPQLDLMSLGYSSGIRRASTWAWTVRHHRSALARDKRVIRLKYGLPLSKTHSPCQRHLYQPFEKGWLTLGWRTRCHHERLKERRSGHFQRTRDGHQLSDEASRRKRLSSLIGGHPRGNRRFFDSFESNVSLSMDDLLASVGTTPLLGLVRATGQSGPTDARRPKRGYQPILLVWVLAKRSISDHSTWIERSLHPICLL